jgi:hypothetical protein
LLILVDDLLKIFYVSLFERLGDILDNILVLEYKVAVFHVIGAGKHNDTRLGSDFLGKVHECFQKREAIRFRHVQVKEDDVGSRFTVDALEPVECFIG